MARAINHMAAPRLGTAAFLRLAGALGCTGVELRCDLGRPVLDGMTPAALRDMADALGLRIHALAELPAFDDWDAAKAEAARDLASLARSIGAGGIVLIPRCDGEMTGEERHDRLRAALRGLAPILDEQGLAGLIEPLGFAAASLRLKSEAAAAIADVPGPFGLVHDTFHHHLAGEAAFFPELTRVVHVSGVTADLPPARMEDVHRGLVAEGDRLGSVAQVAALGAAGWAGPVSMEPFAPEVHDTADPEAALRASYEFMESRLAPLAA